MNIRYFTVEEANKILPEVQRLLFSLMKLEKQLAILNQISISYEHPFLDFRQQAVDAKNYHKAKHLYFSLLNELASLGVFVKDSSIGLADFYSKHNGKDIFLCYQYPEESIQFWHDIDTGYMERKEISLLKKH